MSLQRASSATARQSAIPKLFRPGKNCWRVEQADRFALLIDGEAYFRSLREAILHAERSVFIVGWDIDSRMRLVPGGAPDGLPAGLGEFLQAVVAARPHLHVYVLAWDFAMLYAFEREWMPVFKTGWRSQHRLTFRQDGRHPLGSSHHQKIVVIDDALAFVGGLDLTRSRWDTPAHAVDAPLRRDINGVPYPAFHDVQAVFDGSAAHAMGVLVRERWRGAAERPMAIQTRRANRLAKPFWPSACTPDLTDVNLAIARTEPAYRSRPGVYEIRELYLDAIAAARTSLYFENQYFTANVIGTALSQRLGEAAPPDVVVVSRRTQAGWLQEATMGRLRARLHQLLRASANADHYRLYAPVAAGVADGAAVSEADINVHSKLLFADDEILLVGSANLNNRSMVLDTECNVALFAAGDTRMRQALAQLRNRLLAEHLEVEPAAVTQALQGGARLIAAIEALAHPGRTLQPIEPAAESELDTLMTAATVLDPEQPVAAEDVVRQFLPEERARPLMLRLALLGGMALAVIALLVVWRWTPLGRLLTVHELVVLSQRLQNLPFSPVWFVLAYVVAAVLSIPITLLIGATGLFFGAPLGVLYALVGSMTSALVTYGIGYWLGRDAVRYFAGPRLNRLSERVARRGLLAVVILRVMPIAPFTIVNLVAGASQIVLRDYFFGTLIGMGPGIVLTVVFAHQLVHAVQHPTAASMAVLGLIGCALVALSAGLQRLLGKSGTTTREAASTVPPNAARPAHYDALQGDRS